jgi:multiple sugar transport system permease protein
LTRHLRKPTERLFFQTLAIGIAGILAFPLYWMIVISFQDRSLTYAYPPQLFVGTLHLNNYYQAFEGKPVTQWLGNSALVSIGATLLSIIVSVFAAYSISRFRYFGRSTLAMFILASQMIPATVFVIPYYTIMQRLGLVDTLLGLGMTYASFTVPLCVWMMKGFFDSIPREIEEAAEIDGCNKFQTLILIVLPLSVVGIVSTALFAFITAWQEFMFARTLMASMDNWTASVGIASLRGEYETYWNDIMAAAVVFALPVAVIFILLERYLVAGMTAGAVKG